MCDILVATILVERLLAFDAESGFQRTRRIVDTGVNDLGVPAAGLGADSISRLDDDHFATSQCQGPGHREPDDAGTDHHAFNVGQTSSASHNGSPPGYRPPLAGNL